MKLICMLVLSLHVCITQAQKKIFNEVSLVAVIQKYHPVAAQAALDTAIASANLLSARGAFDPLLSSEYNRKLFDGTLYYDQTLTHLRIPVWYGLDLYAGTEAIDGFRINPEETSGPITYLGLSVPALKNLLMDKRRATLKQAKLFRYQAGAERVNVLNDLLHEGLIAYWNWWEQYQVYRLIQLSLSNAENRFGMVKTAYTLGERPAIDTIEALTQVQQFEIRRSEAFLQLVKARLELSVFLWTETGQPYELPEDIAPQVMENNEAISLDDCLSLLSRHPQIRQYNFKIQSLQIEKRLRFQSMLPEINLKYNHIVKGYDFLNALKASSFQNNYRYGVSFSLPLRLSEGRGEVAKVKFQIEQTRLASADKQWQIEIKIRQYYALWQQTGMQVAQQSILLRNVLALQKGEEVRLQNGESSLFLINAREAKALEAQEKLIALQSKSRKSIISLKWAAALLFN